MTYNKQQDLLFGEPSYSRDMWDSNGLKMISDRVDKSKKSMKQLRDFMQDAASMSFKNAQMFHKLSSLNISSSEFGTLKFVSDRFCELIETMSKNEEILGSKLRTQCYQRLNDNISRFSRQHSKIISELQSWHKSLEKEKKKLRKSHAIYHEKKRISVALQQQLYIEKQNSNNPNFRPKRKSLNTVAMLKMSPNNNSIIHLQQKVNHGKSQAREYLELYIKAVSVYRGFRLKFDSVTNALLDSLEQIEVDRSNSVHKLLKLFLEIQQVMVQQSLKNISTIAKHIEKIDAHSDNMLFVEKYRSNVLRPILPDPEFHEEDDDTYGEKNATKNTSNNNSLSSNYTSSSIVESSAAVKFWTEKWRLVIGKILEHDIELISPKIQSIENTNNMENVDDSFAFVKLANNEYLELRKKCIQSLDTTEGRLAYALIINRQRNSDYGLELNREQFIEIVQLCMDFFDAIASSEPIDIKPAKLVMIMSQSLYVRRGLILDLLTKEETEDFMLTQMTEEKVENVGISENVESVETLKELELKSVNIGKRTQHTREPSFLPKKNKLFVVDRIKDHCIWKNEKFWKEAFCDSVQQEILKHSPIKRWHSEQEQMEGERRNQQIVFSQLAAWTHNMKEFGMASSTIITFLDSHDLKIEQIQVLKDTLQLSDDVESVESVDDEYGSTNLSLMSSIQNIRTDVNGRFNSSSNVSSSTTPSFMSNLP